MRGLREMVVGAVGVGVGALIAQRAVAGPWNYSTVVSCAIPYDDGSGRSAIERMQ